MSATARISRSRWRAWCLTPASCRTRWGADMHGYNTTIPKPRGTPDTHPDKEEMHLFAGKQNFSLASAMTSMLALGLTLEQVVPMVTSHAAAMLRMEGQIGTLRPGVEADISVLEDERGRFLLLDNEDHRVVAERLLRPAFCLRAGIRHEAKRRHPAPSGAGRGGLNDGLKLGVGARLQRKEDGRFLHGRGRYVADFPPSRHARNRLLAQPRGPPAPLARCRQAGSRGGSRLRCGRPGRRRPNPRQFLPSPAFASPRKPVLAQGQAAPRRRVDRRLCGRQPGGGRGPGRASASSSTSRCPPSPICWPPLTRRRPWCTKTGRTTSSWRPGVTMTSPAWTWSPPPRSPAACAPPVKACPPSKAAASSRNGTRGSNN